MSEVSKKITLKIDGVDVDFVRADSVVAQKETCNEVIIRTYSAGVHIGTIKEKEGMIVTLANARRLWSWEGAFTLNAVATAGVNRGKSRISCEVPEITIEAIEIIPIVKGVDLSSTEKQ